jgi:hypothetical protein
MSKDYDDNEDNDLFRKEQIEKFYAESKPLRKKYKPRELTDEEIANIWDETRDIFRKPSMASIQQFARAIIKASRGEK